MKEGGNGANQYSYSANLRSSDKRSVEQAAEMLNVSTRSIATYRAGVASKLANMDNGGWRGNQWQTANLQSATLQNNDDKRRRG